MVYVVDFENVSTVGLETSPVADALAGLRANEARYFKNKYDHVFTVEPAAKAKKASGRAGRPARERGSLLQEQIRPCLHGRTGGQGQEGNRLGGPCSQRRARHRRHVPPARGNDIPGREYPMDVRVLRKRPLDQ